MNDFERQFEQIAAGLTIDDGPRGEHKAALREQALAVCAEASMDGERARVRPGWSYLMNSNWMKGVAAAVVIGGILLAWAVLKGEEEPRVADPKPVRQTAPERPVEAPLQTAAAELALAEQLFAAGDTAGLAALFETGGRETKLAVIDYLSRLGTEEALAALRGLEISGEEAVVREAVQRTLHEEDRAVQTTGKQAVSEEAGDETFAETPEAAVETMEAAGDEKTPAVLDEDNEREGFVGIRVADAVSGRPIAGALLKSQSGMEPFKDRQLTTNAAGRVLFEATANDLRYLRFHIYARGYVPRYLVCQSPDSQGGVSARQYLVEMNRSVPVGGYVKTTEGEPIAGVSVRISTDFTPEEIEFDYLNDTVETDTEGRWTLEDFDPSASRASVSLKHPDYVSTERYSYQPNIELLRSRSCVLLMQKGATVSGHVRRADGTPIAGAMVYEGWSNFADAMQQQTDEQGFYRFENCVPGSMVLTAMAKGYAPELKEFPVTGSAEQDFVLQLGNRLGVRVADTEGRPLAGVRIEARYWRTFNEGQACESIRCKAETGDDGRAVLEDLPADEVLYTISKSGYATLNKFPLVPSEAETEITLWPKGKLKGHVYDAATGLPVLEFRLTEGIQWQGQDGPTWQDHRGKTCREGVYEQPFNYHYDGYAVKIEAEGYLPYESETFYNEGKEIVHDVYLNKGAVLEGIVYDPDGKPAPKADVLVCLKGGWVRIENGRFDQTSSLRLQTDATGLFRLPPQSAEYKLIVLHDSGFARLSEAEFVASGEVRLERWGRIEGTIYRGRHPDVQCELSIQDNAEREWGIGFSVNQLNRVYSDDQGRFSYHRVFPGMVTISKIVKLGGSTEYARYTTVQVSAGETVEVHLGGGGRTVTGRFLNPDAIPLDFNQKDFSVTLSLADMQRLGLDLSGLPDMAVPEDFYLRTPEEMQAWQAEWAQTPQGAAFMQAVQEISRKAQEVRVDLGVVIDSEGRFRIEDVLPGSYVVSGRFRLPRDGRTNPNYYNTYAAEVEFEFTVEEAEDEKAFEAPVDIGAFPVRPITSLEAGQTAVNIAMKDIEGRRFELQDFRGRYVLLDLAASNIFQGEDHEEIELLKTISSAYHDRAELEIVSLVSSSFPYPDHWISIRRAMRVLCERKGIEWTVAFEDSPVFMSSQLRTDYSVGGKPAKFVLVGPDGRILETVTENERLSEAIERHF